MAEAYKQPRFVLEPDSDGYPSTLLSMDVCAPKLYGIGQPESLSVGIGIIGARRATPYGLKAAHMIAGWASEMGLTVYSGCARGCDQAAHRGALAAGGNTVAVLGCGADVPYPSSAYHLLNQIAASGCLVSTYSYGTPPMKYRFRERNRIIVALSTLLVVAEARIPSGTFSAVAHATNLGVAIGAVPGSIFCAESAAPNLLISEGAYSIASKDDLQIACDLTDPGWRRAKRVSQPVEDPVLQALKSMPMNIEEVAGALHLNPIDVAKIVNGYEIEGLVSRYGDGRYIAITSAIVPQA